LGLDMPELLQEVDNRVGAVGRVERGLDDRADDAIGSRQRLVEGFEHAMGGREAGQCRISGCCGNPV
jgi:hypothetical protein